MLEVVIDPVLLHEALDEREIRFTVLGAIFHRLVLLGKATVVEILLRFLLEDLLDDLGRGFVLKALADGALKKKPKPGVEKEAIPIELAFRAKILTLGEYPAEAARFTSTKPVLD